MKDAARPASAFEFCKRLRHDALLVTSDTWMVPSHEERSNWPNSQTLK
jgi:hypothetical protein